MEGKRNYMILPPEAMPSTPEELPGELRQMAEIIAEVIGDDKKATWAAWAVAMSFRGTTLYWCGIDAYFRNYRNRMIIEEFDRRTNAGETATAVVKDLALREWPGERSRISDRTIWDILCRPDDRQMKLF